MPYTRSALNAEPETRKTSRFTAHPALVASAAIFMIVAGLVHLAIAPLHWGHAPAHGLFFAASGLAQLAWGIVFWRKPSAALCRAGMMLAGGMITLWAITRFLPAPFGDEPGEIEVTGVVSKLSEALSLAALVAATNSNVAPKGPKPSSRRSIGYVAIASIAAGGLTYWLGMAAVPVLPGLAESAEPEAVASAEDTAGGSPTSVSSEISANGSLAGEVATPVPDDLQLVVAGIGSPFANGGEVPVAGDVMAQLTFMPGDERYGRDLDVYLYHLDTSTSVDDATIQATGRMRYMDHGTFRQMALPLGQGHYLLLLQFPMPGEWQLELDVTTAGAQNTLYLDLNLFE